MAWISGAGGQDNRMNHFEFFDIEPTLEIDLKDLRKKYILNSRKYHPDYHTNASESEVEESLRMSTLNSKGYEVLSDFDHRLHHVVEIISDGKIEKPQLSPAFLMEMMEVNESIESLDEAGKQALKVEINDRDAQAYQALKDLHSKALDTLDEGEKERIKSYYFEHKYLLRILENLDNLASL